MHMPRITLPRMTTASECAAARSAVLRAQNLHRRTAHAGKCELTCSVCTMLIDAVVLTDHLCKHPAVQEE